MYCKGWDKNDIKKGAQMLDFANLGPGNYGNGSATGPTVPKKPRSQFIVVFYVYDAETHTFRVFLRATWTDTLSCVLQLTKLQSLFLTGHEQILAGYPSASIEGLRAWAPLPSMPYYSDFLSFL